MLKIVLVWWVITPSGVTEPVEWDGWRTMEECKAALVSFTEPNPKRIAPEPHGIVGKCMEIPK